MFERLAVSLCRLIFVAFFGGVKAAMFWVFFVWYSFFGMSFQLQISSNSQVGKHPTILTDSSFLLHFERTPVAGPNCKHPPQALFFSVKCITAGNHLSTRYLQLSPDSALG